MMPTPFRFAWPARPSTLLQSSRLRTSPFRNTRFFADQPNPQPTTRISRLESRLPNFLSRHLHPLRTAPISHITAFLILHELTAIIPLFGLAGIFHYTNWLPPYISEYKWIHEYQVMFGNWMRKKGWIGEDSRREKYWGGGEKGVRIVLELATAYAVTKVLLPVRIVGSVWLTPWFARWTVLPVKSWVGRLFGRKGSKTAGVVKDGASSAAGTGAVAGGVVPKTGK